jgi:VWFA-related protein
MRELQPLSADISGLSRAVQAIAPGGTTAIYDAIYIALRNLGQAANPTEVRRQALVILSDGVDTSSLLPYEDVLDAARRHGVTIYAVSLRSPRPRGSRAPSTPMALMSARVDGDFALRTLAQQTGGQAFFDLASRDLAPACQRIAHELANQYSLGYFPTNPIDDGRFHLLSVHVTTVPGVRARTRTGYFASPETRRARRDE